MHINNYLEFIKEIRREKIPSKNILERIGKNYFYRSSSFYYFFNYRKISKIYHIKTRLCSKRTTSAFTLIVN
ncbi:MAG: hypothetical protein KatS3mg027_2366 [Bacteroidia bacterium]|nr:MAG: hypothetical protein KatS3mg027_2366 [Bacteroidia bacterium]